MGLIKSKQLLRTKVWWPRINTDIEEKISTCVPCQLVIDGTRYEELQPTKLPNGPWESLSADILGPFPTGESVLAVIDGYSRYPEIKIRKQLLLKLSVV